MLLAGPKGRCAHELALYVRLSHPSKEGMRIMADYVEQVLGQCVEP